MRTCIGCRRRTGKHELVRIVRDPGGYVRLDEGACAPGRGAYVCSDVGCLEQAIRRRRIGAALRTVIEAEQLEGLMEEFARWRR